MKPRTQIAACLISTIAAVVACGQPGGGGAPAPAGSASATVNAAPLAQAPRPAGSAAHTWDDDDDDMHAGVAFPNGQDSFAKAKQMLLERYYREGLTEDDLYRAAVDGMATRLDPSMRKWNKLLSPQELAEMQNDLKGELVGIGVRILSFDSATGYSEVGGVIAGSPAEKAGMQPGDLIVTVDGKLYRGQTLRDVVEVIRGKAGETVTLTVLRGDKLLTVPIKRALIAYETTTSFMLPDGIGYLNLHSFNDKTPAAARAALTDLASKSAKALVLDVREHPGGKLDAAVAVASLLVRDGTEIARIKHRGKEDEVIKTTSAEPPPLVDVPMVVVTDQGTSSSAELIASVAQELRHASIVGTHTYGKWTVQSLEDLPNGWAMKFTTGVFTSPSGKSYEGTGLAPDVQVDEDQKQIERELLDANPVTRLARDVQLRTAVGVLKGQMR